MDSRIAIMNIDEEVAWAAFLARDKSQDGRFVIAVRSTGIYCKPSCSARRPKRENVAFYVDGVAAQQAGYRACLRCRPDESARDEQAVAAALKWIGQRDAPPSLAALAAHVGYAPHHFHRLFKRITGVTPATYARKLRSDRLARALTEGGSITHAIYDAGYATPGRAYADAAEHLGMTPSAWKDGGRGESIHFAIVDTSLGSMLVAGTSRGLCRISFDEGEAELRARFPNAIVTPPDASFAATITQVVALIDHPARANNLPIDVRGTAFQQAVWAALRAIPAGETRTYKQIADAIGRPSATRATGTACGDNALAVLIPCHRVLRSDGGLGGYAYGLDRKKKLLARERSDQGLD